MSVIEPGTIPPPSTKSNSLSPVRQRESGCVAMSRSRAGATSPPVLAGPRPVAAARGFGAAIGSSATAFQAPHASQRPTHFG
jgi:hypothetical protein